MARLKQMAWSSQYSFYGHIEATAEKYVTSIYTFTPVIPQIFQNFVEEEGMDRQMYCFPFLALHTCPNPSPNIEQILKPGLRKAWALPPGLDKGESTTMLETPVLCSFQSDFSAVTNLIWNMFIISHSWLENFGYFIVKDANKWQNSDMEGFLNCIHRRLW